jgi:hypothetical protein
MLEAGGQGGALGHLRDLEGRAHARTVSLEVDLKVNLNGGNGA